MRRKTWPSVIFAMSAEGTKKRPAVDTRPLPQLLEGVEWDGDLLPGSALDPELHRVRDEVDALGHRVEYLPVHSEEEGPVEGVLGLRVADLDREPVV